jgi:ParB/RepB/Spo0J family partition protein
MADDTSTLSDAEFEAQTSPPDDDVPPVGTPASSGNPIIDRLNEISSAVSAQIPPPDPRVAAPDSDLGRIFAACLGGGGDIPDAALAEYQRAVQERNGTALPTGAPIACRPHRSPHLAVVKRDLHSRLRRTDIEELFRGRASPPVPAPVIDVQLAQISTEFPNMRSGVDEEADASIAASMSVCPQFAPLVVVKDRDNPEKYILIAGFSRFRIAQELGWTSIKVIVLSISSEFEAYAVNLVENVARAPVFTFDLADRCDFLIRTFGVSVADLAKLLGKVPSYIYQLRSLLTSLPSNALRDWKSRHPAATLPRLVAVSREFDKVAAWERVRGQHEKAESRVLSPSIRDEDESESERDSSGWEEYRRPSKAAIRRMRDVVIRAKLPSDPESLRELAVGLLDWARGATSKVPHVLASPLKKRPRRRAREKSVFGAGHQAMKKG